MTRDADVSRAYEVGVRDGKAAMEAEIKRLTEALATLQQIVDKQIQAEFKARAELARLQTHAEAGWSLANGAHIEAERLRAELDLERRRKKGRKDKSHAMDTGRVQSETLEGSDEESSGGGESNCISYD